MQFPIQELARSTPAPTRGARRSFAMLDKDLRNHDKRGYQYLRRQSPRELAACGADHAGCKST
eukprot:5298206-Pyramimonas_sp.AAC.1